jgi:hypothetical protein
MKNREIAPTQVRWPGAMIRSDFYGLTARIADSSSTNAVSFSSARAMKRCPLSRCASALQTVCPLESIADRNRAGSRLLFLAEFLETRIIPKRIEHWIEPEQRWSQR